MAESFNSVSKSSLHAIQLFLPIQQSTPYTVPPIKIFSYDSVAASDLQGLYFQRFRSSVLKLTEAELFATMPSNKQKSGKLDKKDRQVFIEYLENANASLAHITGWKPSAVPIHGEGRPTTERGETFHVEVWRDKRDGSYKSRIMIGKKGGSKRLIENTELNHGFDEPEIAEVINAHQRQHGIDVSSPTPTDI